MDLAEEHRTDDMAGYNASMIGTEGDVILLVPSHWKREMMSFYVSARMLKPASMVFRVLFDGDFVQVIENAPYPQITLEEDDTDAMAIILRILRHNHQFLPV
ncbi:hypothetical protein LTR17_027716, partial [Elasticomyces elasticus]